MSLMVRLGGRGNRKIPVSFFSDKNVFSLESEELDLSTLLATGLVSQGAKLTRTPTSLGSYAVFAEGTIVKPVGVAINGSHQLITDLSEHPRWGGSRFTPHRIVALNVTDGYVWNEYVLQTNSGEWRIDKMDDGTVPPTDKELWFPITPLSWIA